MEFPGFYGNEQLKSNLSAALDRQRPAHFYLISGPKGSGKHTLARLLSAALLCRSSGKRPCGICNQCHKALTGCHPDLITVDDTEHKTVPVAVIRQAREDLFIRPNEAERKIYFVPRAQDLGLPGQNALLKVLEEPPAYGVFLLLTDNPDKLLPTVRSRCTELKLQPLSRDILLENLRKARPDASPDAVAGAAARSGGWLGQALELLDTGGGWLPETTAFADAYGKKDHLALLRLLTPMEKLKRDQLIPIFAQWRELLASALTCRAGMPPLDPLSRALAVGRTSGELSRSVAALSQAGLLLEGNVSPGAVCGALVWQLR